MRKDFVWIIIFLVVFLVGCKTLDYYHECKGDAACVSKMQEAQRLASDSVHTAGSLASAPTNIVDIVGGIVGAAVFFGTGVFLGRRKKLTGSL